MKAKIHHFLFGVGSLLDILPSNHKFKLIKFRSSAEDIQNIKKDWFRVGQNIKYSMDKERDFQDRNNSKHGG